MRCPYYRKVSGENHPYGFQGYCEADTENRLRVPSLFEETQYCITRQYPACRVFQARQGHLEHAEGPEAS